MEVYVLSICDYEYGNQEPKVFLNKEDAYKAMKKDYKDTINEFEIDSSEGSCKIEDNFAYVNLPDYIQIDWNIFKVKMA